MGHMYVFVVWLGLQAPFWPKAPEGSRGRERCTRAMALSLNDRSAGSGSAAASNRGSAGHVALLSAAHVGRLVVNLCIAVCAGGKHDLRPEASLLYDEYDVSADVIAQVLVRLRWQQHDVCAAVKGGRCRDQTRGCAYVRSIWVIIRMVNPALLSYAWYCRRLCSPAAPGASWPSRSAAGAPPARAGAQPWPAPPTAPRRSTAASPAAAYGPAAAADAPRAAATWGWP